MMTIAEITTPAMAPGVGVLGVSSGGGAGRPVGMFVGRMGCASVGTRVTLSSLLGETVGLGLETVLDVDFEALLDAEELSDMVYADCISAQQQQAERDGQ